MVGDADVEIVESWCLNQPTLHHLGVCRDAIAYESVFENIEIGTDSCGMNATLLSYVIVVDNLSVGECSHLQKALKSIEIADESLFLDFFLQVYVYISFQKTLRALGKVMGGNHAVGDSTVDFEIGYLGTDQGVEVNGKGASSQCVMSLALQFAGAGAAE